MADELDFKTTEDITKEDVHRLQKRLLEMANAMTSILDKYGYHYMIACGTLLGAVRHKGYFPWDNDFDMFLFDDEYDAAVQCLRDHLPEDMIVHDKKTDPIYWPAWSRLRDLHSRTYGAKYTDDDYYKYTGLTLDLYRLTKMKRSEVALWKKKSAIEFLVRKHDVGVLPDDQYREQFDEWTTDYVELLRQNVTQGGADDEVYSALIPTLSNPIEVDDIFPLKKYQFADTEFWGPNNADHILTIMYGDYMQVPPYERRRLHLARVEFD